MKIKHTHIIFFFVLLSGILCGQEGLPIYSDYLTDNYYLLHPSTAGIGINGKLRLTGRQQWFDTEDAPSLQTISVSSRIGETSSGIGGSLFADKNGFHSQTGGYLTYAHHIMFSRNPIDLNMLSFGLSAGFIQYGLNESTFLENGIIDPAISGIALSAVDFNVDAGLSYNFLNFYAHFTVKNILENNGVNFNEQGLSFNNLRTFILSAGYSFHQLGNKWSFEPSALIANRSVTNETFFDGNFKVSRKVRFGKIWGGASYRTSFDGAEYISNNQTKEQRLQYYTGFIGATYKKYMFAYTYSYQANSVVFSNSGLHQVTLGLNFGKTKEKYECDCPSIND